MNGEFILLIIYAIVILALFYYFVHLIIESKKEFLSRDKRRKDFLGSLQHGSIFVERSIPERDNPFLRQDLKHVVVLETRVNKYGEIWVKYQIENDDGIWYCPAQNFDRLFEKI